jgi:hypothetical protein
MLDLTPLQNALLPLYGKNYPLTAKSIDNLIDEVCTVN